MSNTSDAEIQALLADLWKRHLPQLIERLTLLEQMADQAAHSGLASLSEEQRAEAQSTAHKLAGNLGMFGHKHAGDTASQIEQTFKSPTPETLAALPTLVAQLRQALSPHLATNPDN
jgi:HPt (histidine-containing phosphotransfer) domain-containing protein